MYNIDDLIKLPREQVEAVLGGMSPRELIALQYEWKFWARANQLPPEYSQSGTPWTYWLALAGRGFGKTRMGAEWVRMMVESGKSRRMAFIAPTNADLRNVMVEGESGLLAISPPWNKPRYEPSKMRVTWPNGAIASLYSAEEPERLRGPQHDAFWADELAAWGSAQETWDMLQFGFRLGRAPQGIITTTPKPIPLVKSIMKNAATAITRGSTYDNRQNLAKPFFDQVVTSYEGTRLGRQELDGEVLEDNPNAMFQASWFEKARIARKDLPPLERIGVAVDPAVSANVNSNETGIVGGGKFEIEGRYHYYILCDETLSAAKPEEWGRRASSTYHRLQADFLIGEVNNGGDMIEAVIRSADPGREVNYRKVTATRGKQRRAEPVAALAEQGRIHMVGYFKELEDQCCNWDPTIPDTTESPDRMDAMVWLVSYLSGAKGRGMTQGSATGG